jgi:hypothetical protein
VDAPIKSGHDGFLFLDNTMKRIKAHLTTFLMAVIFGALAYGVIHAGLKLHRWLDPDSLTNRSTTK